MNKASPRLTLYVTRPGFGLPETSPFVMKSEVQLQMAGLDHARVPAIPPQAPSGKLPYLEDDGEVITDSTFIRAHIERRYGVDLDAGLDARRRAEAWAVERLLEDHLYFAMVWYRWIDPVNFAKGPAHFADNVPEERREAMRRDMHARKVAELQAQGLGRHTPERIAELGCRSVDSLGELLADRHWFMGDTASAVDATAFGMLAAVLAPLFDTPLRSRVEAHPNLTAYVARMMRRYYPGHAWAARAA